jgi:hypothetical protein
MNFQFLVGLREKPYPESGWEAGLGQVSARFSSGNAKSLSRSGLALSPYLGSS